ncbi:MULTISPECIES: hypothetical protein [Rhodomicrobium]|uniref:hypothetical protein n=1 Tax=Rhodomicrobium TaxID=1068 RepID=UPI000F73D787|nr:MULTISPECIES: hypothetical protein [Rhodomicrobium]
MFTSNDNKASPARRMRPARPLLTSLTACGLLILASPAVQAGLCTPEIAHFEDSTRYMDSVPSGKQTIGAQLHHQPTPESVEQATKAAETGVAATLAKARDLDSKGEDTACLKLLDDAKLRFGIQ